MKSILASFLALIAVSFAFVGFQCSSAELTSAKLYMQRKEYDKAEEQLLKDVTNNPQDGESWYYLGYVRGELKKWADMMDAFDHALKISDAHKNDITLAKEHYWIESYNEGTKSLQNARSDSTAYQKAVSSFNTAILIEPDSTMSYQGLAYTYLNMGIPDSALAPFMKLWTTNQNEEAAKYIGEIYFEDGQKLKQDFENDNGDKLTNIKNVNSIYEGQSVVEVTSAIGQPDEKKVNEASKSKGKKIAQRSGPTETWTYKTYGLTLTFENDRLRTKQVDFVYNPGVDSTKYMQALVEYKKALDIIVPATKLYPEDQSLTTVMTNCYIAANQTAEATETFREAAEKNPQNPDFQYNYGVILLKGLKYEPAIAQFKKAIDASVATLDQLSQELSTAESSNDSEKTKELIADTTRTKTTQWNAMYNLGASYVNWGVEMQHSAPQNSDPDSLRKVVSAKFQDGLPYLEKYSTYKSDDPNLWELMAKVYAFTNNEKKAEDAIQRADELRQIH